jgi:mycoredoxin
MTLAPPPPTESGDTPSVAPSVVPAVTMFSTVWCGYCQRLKAQFSRAGITWHEVDIEHDAKAAQVVREVNNGCETVPTILFSDGTALSNPSLKQVQEKIAALR